MTLELQAALVLQLLVAAFLGLVVGMEREYRSQPAGLRTHMLVAVGACLFTQLSRNAFPESDPARIAAQIVVGIGFLGAGTIVSRGDHPHHLTTAASIWATSAIGMAVGAGAWFLALGAAVIVWLILAVVRRFSKSDNSAATVLTSGESA